MRTHTLHLEDLDEPMTQNTRLESGVRCFQRGSEAKTLLFVPNALLLRQPESGFAEKCFISARKAGTAIDHLDDIPLAHLPQDWERLLPQPVPAVLD